jgi:hypothetical protein
MRLIDYRFVCLICSCHALNQPLRVIDFIGHLQTGKKLWDANSSAPCRYHNRCGQPGSRATACAILRPA